MKELLAPAGDMKSLEAAIHGGADAIYVGMKEFGARKFALNFTKEEITEAIKLCHLYGVRLYVTLNTVIKDSEVNSFLELVSFLYDTGIDAFIMQDFGMISYLLEIYEDIEIHASTQFNNSNIHTIQLLKDMGVKRVVLSRELTIDEIKKINIDIEKEVFIHGALCISYSGNCLFSSMLGSRSGNRGECTGCCRLPYELYDQEQFIKSGYLLSTKELNTSMMFQKLLDSDIKSFKIEGRMKSPEYVYFVTKFYRNIIDGKAYTDYDIERLKILFHREFTTGNLFQDSLINSKSPNHIGLKIGKVVSISKDKIKIQLDHILHQEDGIRFSNSKKGMIVNFLYNENHLLTSSCKDICYIKNNINLKIKDDVYLTSSKYLSNELLNYPLRKVPINIHFKAHALEKCSMEVSDGIHQIFCEGDFCDLAKNSSLSKEIIKEKLSKLGNTVYEINNIQIDIDDNLFIPVKNLNQLRRKCIAYLNEARLSLIRKKKRIPQFEQLAVTSTKYDTIIVDNERELLNCLHYQRIYVKDISLFHQYQDHKNIYYIERENTIDEEIQERSLVHEYQYPKCSISNYSFNVTNIYSVYYLHRLGYSCVSLSVELTDSEISFLIKKFYDIFGFYPNVEVVFLDRIELMLIKGNILDININKEYRLVDSKKRNYPVYFDGVNTHILDNKILIKNMEYHGNRRYHYKYLK